MRLTGSMISNVRPAQRLDQLGIERIERLPPDPVGGRPQGAEMRHQRRLACGAPQGEPARRIGELEAIMREHPVGDAGAKLAQLRRRRALWYSRRIGPVIGPRQNSAQSAHGRRLLLARPALGEIARDFLESREFHAWMAAQIGDDALVHQQHMRLA